MNSLNVFPRIVIKRLRKNMKVYKLSQLLCIAPTFRHRVSHSKVLDTTAKCSFPSTIDIFMTVFFILCQIDHVEKNILLQDQISKKSCPMIQKLKSIHSSFCFYYYFFFLIYGSRYLRLKYYISFSIHSSSENC